MAPQELPLDPPLILMGCSISSINTVVMFTEEIYVMFTDILSLLS